MSDANLLKANFALKAQVSAQPMLETAQEQFRKKAIESIGGSMVFVEREQLFWDGK